MENLNNNKKIIGGILGAATLFGTVATDISTKTPTEIVDVITAEQTIYKAVSKSYREKEKTYDGENLYWVNEYVSNEGSGYETVIVRIAKDGSLEVMQKATGPEAKYRSFDWRPYNPNPL